MIQVNQDLIQEVQKLTKANKAEPSSNGNPYSKSAWGNREKSKLMTLNSFWGRINNLHLSCDKDRKRLAKLLAQYQASLKS